VSVPPGLAREPHAAAEPDISWRNDAADRPTAQRNRRRADRPPRADARSGHAGEAGATQPQSRPSASARTSPPSPLPLLFERSIGGSSPQRGTPYRSIEQEGSWCDPTIIDGIRFLREVADELRRVSWPTRREVITYSVVVIITVGVLGALVYGLDVLFSRIVVELLER
jgi:preprotein translocase subunit SecE